jgi:hypothetical protein
MVQTAAGETLRFLTDKLAQLRRGVAAPGDLVAGRSNASGGKTVPVAIILLG